jgi:hypothetical protein
MLFQVHPSELGFLKKRDIQKEKGTINLYLEFEKIRKS